MKIKAALLICVFLCLILFSGATDTVLEPVETPVASYSGGQFKYIDHSSGRVSLVVGDTLFSFDEDGGNVAVSSCSGRIRSSLVKGGSACFITDNGYSLSFEEHSVYGGIIRSADSIIDPSLYGYVTAMTVGGKGNVWLIVKDKELYFCNTHSGEAILAHKFSKRVSSLHWVDSCLYAVSGSKVYFCEGTENVDASSYTELASKPMRFYDGGVYVDYNGNFCSGGSVLSSSPVPDAGAVSHYSDGTYAWYQRENNVAVKTDLYGNIIAEYRTKGLICAVCDEGLVTVKDGKLCFAPYASAPIVTPTPEPTPVVTPTATPNPSTDPSPRPTSAPTAAPVVSPSAAPTVSPTDDPETSPEESEPSEVPDERVELPEDYLRVEVGTKVREIISSVKCEIWYKGEKITSGNLRTGMLAKYEGKEVEIVVGGDVNGSGTVNSADFKAMQNHLLATEKLSGAYYLAADISGNGNVGTEDLVLILKKFQ